MPGAEGWANAAGFSGHGVPQAGDGRQVLMAEEICHGRARSLDVDSLRYERFVTGEARREQNIV